MDEKGPAEGYRLVGSVMRATPDPWIEPLEVKVLGLDDSLAEAVLAATKARPYPGMTRFSGTTLAGVSMDAALVYPLAPPA